MRVHMPTHRTGVARSASVSFAPDFSSTNTVFQMQPWLPLHEQVEPQKRRTDVSKSFSQCPDLVYTERNGSTPGPVPENRTLPSCPIDPRSSAWAPTVDGLPGYDLTDACGVTQFSQFQANNACTPSGLPTSYVVNSHHFRDCEVDAQQNFPYLSPSHELHAPFSQVGWYKPDGLNQHRHVDDKIMDSSSLEQSPQEYDVSLLSSVHGQASPFLDDRLTGAAFPVGEK